MNLFIEILNLVEKYHFLSKIIYLYVLNECVEALFIEIDKQQMNKPKNIIVGLIYRPPNTNIVYFNSYISDLLMSIKCESVY